MFEPNMPAADIQGNGRGDSSRNCYELGAKNLSVKTTPFIVCANGTRNRKPALLLLPAQCQSAARLFGTGV